MPTTIPLGIMRCARLAMPLPAPLALHPARFRQHMPSRAVGLARVDGAPRVAPPKILLEGDDLQMRGINAPPVLAEVVNLHALWDVTDHDAVDLTVRHSGYASTPLARHKDLSVPIRVRPGRPNPANVRTADAVPESRPKALFAEFHNTKLAEARPKHHPDHDYGVTKVGSEVYAGPQCGVSIRAWP